MEQREKSSYHVDLTKTRPSQQRALELVLSISVEHIGPRWSNLYFLTLPSHWIQAALGRGAEGQGSMLPWKQTLKKTTNESSLLTVLPAAGQQVFP